MNTTQPTQASEYRHLSGVASDVTLSDFTDPEFLDDACPLCSEPLNGERFFHLECGKRENAADRWEREGRAEMYYMLDLTDY